MRIALNGVQVEVTGDADYEVGSDGSLQILCLQETWVKISHRQQDAPTVEVPAPSPDTEVRTTAPSPDAEARTTALVVRYPPPHMPLPKIVWRAKTEMRNQAYSRLTQQVWDALWQDGWVSYNSLCNQIGIPQGDSSRRSSLSYVLRRMKDERLLVGRKTGVGSQKSHEVYAIEVLARSEATT